MTNPAHRVLFPRRYCTDGLSNRNAVYSRHSFTLSCPLPVNFMRRLKSICVYCGSSNRGPSRHQKAAIELGRELAEAGIELVFGGGRVGLMGRLADGALKAGGRVTGVIPEHLIRAEVGHAKVTS